MNIGNSVREGTTFSFLCNFGGECMYVAELIATIDNNMPNDIADGSIINWVNFLEDYIYQKVIGSLNIDPFISEDGLSERDKYKPDLKTLDLADTQTLALEEFGYRWIQMYEYYIYAQISMLKEEFGKANNYIMLYNSLVDEFVALYFSRYKSERDWR